MEELVIIEYFNHHQNRFVLFYRGDKEAAGRFMQEHGHLHRVYKIELETEGIVQEQVV